LHSQVITPSAPNDASFIFGIRDKSTIFGLVVDGVLLGANWLAGLDELCIASAEGADDHLGDLGVGAGVWMESIARG
jgi:hypothetical protein